MYDTIDAEYQYASIYYILYILIACYILLNLFVAGVSSVFFQLRRKNQVPSHLLHFFKPISSLRTEPESCVLRSKILDKVYSFFQHIYCAYVSLLKIETHCT